MDYLHFAITTRGWSISNSPINPTWFCYAFNISSASSLFSLKSASCWGGTPSYYRLLQKCSCPTRFWRLEVICHFNFSRQYSSLWKAKYLLEKQRTSLDSIDTRIDPFYEHQSTAVTVSSCSCTQQCSCPWGVLGDQLWCWILTSFLGSYSTSTKGLRPVPHLLP